MRKSSFFIALFRLVIQRIIKKSDILGDMIFSLQ